MKIPILLGFSALTLSFAAFVPEANSASAKDVLPIPQMSKNSSGTLPAESLSASAKKIPAISEACKSAKISPAGTAKIVFDKTGEKLKSKIKNAKLGNDKIPVGAYWINVSGTGIEISAADPAGKFYALQTIAQMIEIDGKIALGEILDWPDIAFRGTVEGYYGDPWSTEARKRQFQFYGKYKLNTYIYGPKDDPFHRNRWRENYPKNEADALRELVKFASENHVNFVWAVHLGGIFNENKKPEEFKALLAKLDFMYSLGIRSFGVFFDDFGKADANLQSEICNYIVQNFLKKKNDCTPLVMCPSQYNRGWTSGNYLDVLGEKLDPEVNVMWTGNSVCHNITAEGIDWVSKRIRRNPYIWWNWPVTDYCKEALTMGRTYGLESGNKGKINGMTLNPMDKAEASLVGILGGGIWAWNIDKFESDKVWKDLIKRTFSSCASSLQTFANHNSDQGPNVHGYRREESVDFKSTLDAAKSEYAGTKKFSAKTKKALLDEFSKIEKAGKELVKTLPSADPMLYDEIQNWLKAFTYLGKAGTSVVAMLDAGTPEKKFEAAENVARSFDKMEEASAAQIQKVKKYSRGVHVGHTHITPFVEEIFTKEWENLYKSFGGNSAAGTTEGPLYKIFTNVPALKNVQVVRDGKYVKVDHREQITLAPKQFVGIELPEGIYGNYVHMKLENSQASKLGNVEISKDGAAWEKFSGKANGAEIGGNVDEKKKIRFFRYTNTSGKPIQIKAELMKFDVPEHATATSKAAMFDGNPRSSFSFVNREILTSPKPNQKAFVLSNAPDCIRISPGKIEISPKKDKPVKIFEIIWK